MNYSQFISQFNIIKDKGFIKSQRRGDGAAGNTFEDELGLEENNIAAPDIEGNELKVKRKGASGLQTLFNKEGEWQMKQINGTSHHNRHHRCFSGRKSVILLNKLMMKLLSELSDNKLLTIQ